MVPNTTSTLTRVQCQDTRGHMNSLRIEDSPYPRFQTLTSIPTHSTTTNKKSICPLQAMPAKIHLSTKGGNPTIKARHIPKKYHPLHSTHLSVVKGNKICPQRKARKKASKTFVPKSQQQKKIGDVYPYPQNRKE